MAKLTFILDTRSGAGEFPLKLRITHHSKSVHISQDIRLAPEQWDGEKVINHPREKSLNEKLIASMALAKAAILKFEKNNNLEKLSAAEVKAVIESDGESSRTAKGQNFEEFFLKCIALKKQRKTILSYESSLKRMRLYDPLLSTRTFDDIDDKYIKDMDAVWEAEGLTTNSRAVYFRNIRAVFNDAIDEDLTKNYPFRRFSIKKTPTKKRNLSVEELRMLRDYPIVNEFQQKYRDIFMLCFYLRGINVVDLVKLTKRNLRAGRINYIRSKTGKFYSVKIEPEALELINKYKGTQYLIDICDGAKDEKEFTAKYEGFLQRMDRGLKKIGPYTRKGLGGKKFIEPILPDLSQYWCRHTSATLMSRLGYSTEVIGCSLGHDVGAKVTNIYIEYNEEEVDKANRALIDYVNAE